MAGTRLTALTLTSAERAELSTLASRGKTSQALALRARMVLACASGARNQDVAAKLGIHSMTVGKWRRRYLAQRLEGLRDEPRCGAPRKIDDARIEAVIVRTIRDTSALSLS